MSNRVSIPALRDKTRGGFWTIHCDDIAALVAVIEGAHALVSAEVFGNGNEYDDPDGVNKEFWAAYGRLRDADARLDFGE